MKAARIVLDEPVVIPKAWCWRDDWATGYDSAYGLLSKFASLNMLGAHELARLFASRQRGQRTALIKVPAIDLRNGALFDQAYLAQLLRIGDTHLEQAFLHGKIDLRRRKLSAVLRWCPDCAHSGFHAAAFQFDFVDVCPAHDKPILSRCPDCGQTIPYRLQADVFRNPFCCPACGMDMAPLLRETKTHSLTSRSPDMTWIANLSAVLSMEDVFLPMKLDLNRQRRRDRLGEVIFARSDWRRPATDYSGFVTHILDTLADAGSQPAMTAAPANIQATVMRPTRLYLKTNRMEQSRGRKYWPATHAASRKWKKGWDVRLRASYLVYAAVRRYLWRHVVHAHRPCIQMVARQPAWGAEGGHACCCCPVAQAFLQWRMYWEGIGRPAHLFAPPVHPPSGLAGWMGADAPICPPDWSRQAEQWACDHVLGMHCFASFNEFFQLAKRRLHEGNTEMHPSKMVGTLTPYWALTGRNTIRAPVVLYRRHNPEYRFHANTYRHPASRAHRLAVLAVLRSDVLNASLPCSSGATPG